MSYSRYCEKCGCGIKSPTTEEYRWGQDCPACHDKTEFDFYDKIDYLLHLQIQREEKEQQTNGPTKL